MSKQFLSLEIEDPGLALDFIESHRVRVPEATWATADKMHVTLRFFSKEPRAVDLKRLMDDVAANVAPFHLTLRGTNTFTNRVLWASPHPFSVIQALGAKLGTPRFRPHLTLAKTEGGDTSSVFTDIADENPATEFGTMPAHTVSLMRTVGGGQPYVKLYSVQLHGDPVPEEF